MGAQIYLYSSQGGGLQPPSLAIRGRPPRRHGRHLERRAMPISSKLMPNMHHFLVACTTLVNYLIDASERIGANPPADDSGA
jgi:hypothetical protein